MSIDTSEMGCLGGIDWSGFDWQSFATLFTGVAAVGGATFVGLRQTTISRVQTEILDRQVQLQHQALKLELLDRRAVAIDAVMAARQEFSTKGAATKEVVEKTSEAMQIAALVFDEAQRDSLLNLLKSLLRWQMYDRRRARCREQDDAKLQEAVDKMMAEEELITERLDELTEELPRLSRIELD